MGNRHRGEKMLVMQDPRGKPVYWIGPPGEKQDAGEGTDFHAIEQGFVSITPLQVDMTAYASVAELASWIGEFK